MKEEICSWQKNNEIHQEKICGALIDHAPVGILIVDKSGTIKLANNKGEIMFGFSKGEMTGKSVHTLVPDVLQEHHSKYCNNYFSNPSHREMGMGMELMAKRKDGTLFPTEIALSYVKIVEEELTVNFISDITKRKIAEEKLKQAREEFLTIFTHDLKSPLASIMSFTELMVEPETVGSLNPDILEYIMMIRHSGEILRDLINNIVEASRMEAGEMVYNIEKMRLDDLLKELKKTFKAIAAQSSITLDFTCPENTWLMADYEKLRQVFHNLIGNAIRYVPDGFTIGIRADDKEDIVQIQVWDNGYGIPEEEQSKIFEKFKQVKGERTGTGLGLYIVKKILKGQNSDINIESKVNKGTKFFFSLKKSQLTETGEEN